MIGPAHRRTAAALVLFTLMTACGPDEIPTGGGAAGMRRLTEDQYRNSIADVFGSDILIAGRFDPVMRPEHGLLAAGTSEIAVSPSGFEQYYAMANGIASQVLDPTHRTSFVGCTPRDATAADPSCAQSFFRHVGRLLFRRPLSDAEIAVRVAAAGEATKLTGDFYDGLRLGLAGLLTAPDFIFDIDATEPDPDHAGQRRLTAYAKASRLSFYLWNTTPDLGLLAAADSGKLHTSAGVAAEVERLMASPRLTVAVRTFFADMLGFESIPDLVKDPILYPQFVRAVKADMPEQTLRTITHLVMAENADYRDLFTTRKTFMTRALGLIYRVPVADREGWTPYEFPASEPRAGILSLMSFLAAFSHDGRSSPTLRGKAVRERLLCQPVPIPPGDVDFNPVQNTANPALKTTRARLDAHRTNPTCAGCHRVTDPIGLGLENFDTVGVYRASENGAAIDTSGDLDGTPFQNAAELGRAVRDNPATTACLVNRMYEYAARRPVAPGERAWLTDLGERFAEDGYRIPSLIRRIATSDAFFRVAEATTEPAP